MDYYHSLLVHVEAWGIPESHFLAYCSTLLISIAPFLLLFLVSFENKPEHQNLLRLGLSFASGGLLGDAFLHLIPHSMGHGHDHHEHGHEHGHAEGEHGHDHSHEHENEHEHEHGHHDHSQLTNVGLYIVLGIVLFFLIEKLLHSVNGDAGGHAHSHAKVSSSEDSDDDSSGRKKKNTKSQKRKKINKLTKATPNRKISGVLNLIADFLHNFTDGLAIGATFAAGKGMGSITAFTILFHEIPHEIGDYAILIQAGYRRNSALGLQLVTAVGAMLGTTVGLYYGTLEDATQFILPITAGGFIYIATVSVLPELMMHSKISHCQSLLETIALGAGIAMMYWIALLE